MTTWRKLIYEVLEEIKEPIISTTLSESELDTEFDPSYGLYEGTPFTAWTENWVLFPIGYDGAEWVGCVPRHPNGFKTEHQGAGG